MSSVFLVEHMIENEISRIKWRLRTISSSMMEFERKKKELAAEKHKLDERILSLKSQQDSFKKYKLSMKKVTQSV